MKIKLNKYKNLGKIFKAAIAIVLFLWVFRAAGLTSVNGFKAFIKPLMNANLIYLTIALLFIPIMDFVSTLKWFFLSKAKHVNISYYRLFYFYVIGRFFNLILPSSIGGDLIRIHLQGRQSKNMPDAAAIVLTERVTGLLTLMFLAAISSIFAARFIDNNFLILLLLVSAIVLFVVICFVLNDNLFDLIFKLADRFHSAGINRIFDRIKKMRNSVKELSKDKRAIFFAFVNSIFFYAVAVLNAWFSILVFDESITLITMVFSIPIIMFLMNIPLSIGNLGVMEFSYTAVLTVFGVPAGVALSLSLFMRIKTFIAAGFGGIFYILHRDVAGHKQGLESELANLDNKL